MAVKTKTNTNTQSKMRQDIKAAFSDSEHPFNPIIRFSILAGIILLYVGVIGMLEAFHDRDILEDQTFRRLQDPITLGQLLLVIPSFLAGFYTTNKMRQNQPVAIAILGGTLVGLLTAIPTLLMLTYNTQSEVRQTLPNVNRDWIEIITFDHRDDLLLGGQLLCAVLAFAGFVGAVLNAVPNKLRNSLIFGVSTAVLVSVMGTTVRLVLQEHVQRDVLDEFFRRDVMLLKTGLGIFSVNTILALFWFYFNEYPKAMKQIAMIGAGILAIALVPLALVSLQGEISESIGVIGLAMVIALGLSALWLNATGRIPTKADSKPQSMTEIVRIGSYALLMGFLLIIPFLVGRALSDTMVTIGLFVLMGLGLNIAIGLAGLLDLGYVTNYAVGAYVMAVFISTGPLGLFNGTHNYLVSNSGGDVVSHWMGSSDTFISYWTTGTQVIVNFWMVIPVALLAAMLAGFIFAVPVLKMRGDYLAIATLGFGEIIGRLAVSDALRPVIGGAQGMAFLPNPVFLGTEIKNPEQIYYVILAACIITLLVSVRLNNSRTGRQWMAIREDEDVALAMGIDTARAKLLAFTLSAATGGVAGAIFATKVGTVFPNSFTVIVSINVLSLIIVGGMGSNPGIVIGAIVLIGLPELLREFSDFRWLMYGVLLVWMMVNRPEGLVPSQVRQRELKTEIPTGGAD